jgi:pimeloyl-ACP methyl ester carboxylesterase
MKFIILTIFIALTFNACSKSELYEISLNYQRAKSGLKVKTAETSHAKIHYLDNLQESNKTLVLIHGFGGDKDNWSRFANSLKDDYRVIIPDLAGFGDSVLKDDINLTIGNQTKILGDFLDSLNVKNFYIVGNSMGGAIALNYTYKNSKKVKALVLIDALGVLKDRKTLKMSVEENPLLHICSKEKFIRMVNLSMEKPPYIPGIFASVLADRKCARRDLEEKIFKQMMIDADQRNIIDKIQTPTLIIWGKLDQILSVDNAKVFHKNIKNSKLIIYDGLGHIPLLEDPDKTAKSVEDFIK